MFKCGGRNAGTCGGQLIKTDWPARRVVLAALFMNLLEAELPRLGRRQPLYTYKYINKPYKYYIYIKPYYNIYTTSTLLSLYMFVCSFAL